MPLSKTTLSKESRDHCWPATALAVELSCSPNVREKFWIMCSLALILILRRKALPVEANLESCMPMGSSCLRWPWRLNGVDCGRLQKSYFVADVKGILGEISSNTCDK